MHPGRSSLRGLLLALFLVGPLGWHLPAQAEPPLPLDLDDSRSALSIGEELEKNGRWLDAIQHYDRSLERWPDDEDLKYGRRRARVHFRVERRYADRSFRDSLLSMSRNQALDLFDETTIRIRASFVESLSHLSIVAHGTESLYIAMANPRFLEANLPPARSEADRDARKEAVKNFRRLLRDQYWNRPVASDQQARNLIAEISRLASQSLRMSETAVVMEYVFGGCNALDDYSGFLTADRFSDLKSNIDGEFVGLGVEMKEESGKGMLLVNILPESPASGGGLRKGDRIVSIDGVDVRNRSIDEAASMMRGPVGSRVSLRIARETGTEEWDTTLTRRPVLVRSIPDARIIDQGAGIAYLKLTSFQTSTAQELDDALNRLQLDGMKALIIDLRGNPGGLLNAAVEVLDRFIDQGVLVSTRGRTSDQNLVYRAQDPGAINVPLVILTDGDSASASEIVAGAIKDHRRGTLVGRKTFGKWSVQSIFNVGSDTGLRLTTAKFYSPNGHTLGRIGVEPDVPVELVKEHSVAFRGASRRNAEPSAASDADIDEGIAVLKRQLRR